MADFTLIKTSSERNMGLYKAINQMDEEVIFTHSVIGNRFLFTLNADHPLSRKAGSVRNTASKLLGKLEKAGVVECVKITPTTKGGKKKYYRRLGKVFDTHII